MQDGVKGKTDGLKRGGVRRREKWGGDKLMEAWRKERGVQSCGVRCS